MVIPRDFHVLDPPRANLARRLNSLVVFLVAILHLYKRLMRTKPVAALLVGVVALRSGLLELSGGGLGSHTGSHRGAMAGS